MDEVSPAPKMVAADIPERGRIYYLVDDQCDFIPEAKEFFDWNAATKRAPATLKAYCSRLLWYYRFLWQRHLRVLDATPADLTEFVIWLCNPYRESADVSPIHQVSPLTASSVNLILQTVGAFYRFLVRRGKVSESPVCYVDVPRGKWLTERDLLAHTRRGQAVVQRMELKLKEPGRLPSTVSEQDFQTFIDSIHMGQDPNGDPSGFRDRLLCLMLKEGGFRIGEILGLRMEDLEFGKQGVHIRFRPDNENGARAKAGYGRDRFVHLPGDILGLLDIYLTEVWIEASPTTSHLWIVLNKCAKDREGSSTYGAALTVAAVEHMFQYYSKKSGIRLHPHVLRRTYSSRLRRYEPIQPTRERGKNMSRNWLMLKRLSKPSKRRASGMDASTIARQARSEQCRKNAQAKSEQKRQATFAAIRELQQGKHPVTRSAVARRAGVSVVFLRSHPDLLQAIAVAEQQHRFTPEDRAINPAKDVVIAALRRRLEEQKQALAEKDAELRQKQREIDHLYGKLAVGSSLTDEELRQQLHSALMRLARIDDQPSK